MTEEALARGCAGVVARPDVESQQTPLATNQIGLRAASHAAISVLQSAYRVEMHLNKL